MVCEDCDGDGETGFDLFVLESSKLNPKGKHFDELHALKQDAARVRKEARRLSDLVPSRWQSYAEQELATLAVIEAKAEKLWREHI